MTRRELLQVGVGVSALGVVSGCGPISARYITSSRKVELPTLDRDSDLQFLDRVTFGTSDLELARLKAIGREKFLEEQLGPKLEESPAFLVSLSRYEAIRTEAVEMMDTPKEQVIRQLQGAAIIRATYSKNQVFERMVDFWSNHFNVFSRKNDGAFYKGPQEEKIIRAHALGNFKDILAGMAHSPAMLLYLDNDLNYSGKPNENYARELLELHTMGVHGGYSQKDIQEVARCFSGWTVESRFLRPRGKFRFNPDVHDNDAKSVLGTVIPKGLGEKDGQRVIEILANHPATAKYIAFKLIQYFMGPDPNGPSGAEALETPLVKRIAEKYLESKGEIRATVQALFMAPEFAEAIPRVRRPFEYLVSALRLTNARTDASQELQNHLRAMGQLVYEWPMPDGYPVKSENWVGSMLPRWNFARALAFDQISGTSIDQKMITMGGVTKGSNDLALYLASPKFQWI